MAIDYSKWDKLELSDDSDVEVHPNVDKRSFINWKQRDIHEKRQQRNQEIKSILVQLTMYAKLNERVDFLLKELSLEEILNNAIVVKKINEKFDKDEKFDYDALIKQKGDNMRKGLKDLQFDASEFENTPPYNEMVEDLFIQVKEDHPEADTDASKLVDYVKEHRAKIDDILSKQSIKLDELLYQKSLLISSDDYHTGFDRSFLNKTEDEPKPSKPPAKEQVTTVETINSPGSSELPKGTEEKSDKELLEELEVLPETSEFSKIPMDDYTQSTHYLIKHPWICSEQQKDALIMTAFDHQLAGDSKAAKQVIHQSLLLQYVAQLAGPKYNKEGTIKAINLFMGKLNDPLVPVKSGFMQDFETTFSHIKKRCEVIKQEHEEQQGDEGEAVIQLRSLDDGTELSVSIPEQGTEEYKVFSEQLPVEMQNAVKTQSLDEVNKVFATYQIEEAEKILEIINQCGVIGVTGYIEDENEFEELQKQYHEQQIDDQERVLGIETEDIVD